MKKFIAIEGVDGSGKSTQIGMLKKYADNLGLGCRRLHFPRTGQGVYGDLVARFLRGEFGPAEKVDPYLVSLLYAGDRKDAAAMIEEWLGRGLLVLVDRYLYSNIAYQCAKIDDETRKLELEKWILEFEYGYNLVPKPDLSIFLHAPFSFVERKLAGARHGDDRAYLKGKKDIHETSGGLQKKVEREYLRLAGKYGYFMVVDCAAGDGKTMLSPEKIHAAVVSVLKEVAGWGNGPLVRNREL